MSTHHRTEEPEQGIPASSRSNRAEQAISAEECRWRFVRAAYALNPGIPHGLDFAPPRNG